MVDISTLNPGDRVRIVDRWPADGSARQNPDGKMDKWLGSVMTVSGVGNGFVKMLEDCNDRHSWGWA